MARILLVKPPWYILQGTKGDSALVGLAYIAAVLREDGHEVIIYDGDFSAKSEELESEGLVVNTETYVKRHDLDFTVWHDYSSFISSFRPDIVGMSIMTPEYRSASNIARLTKKFNKNIPIIAGGVHPTLVPEQTLKESDIDIVVVSEGEVTAKELIRVLNSNGDLSKVNGISYKKSGNIKHTPSRDMVENLDAIPFPAYDLIVNVDKYSPESFGGVITSRACPYQCTYCASPQLWGRKVRYRSIENVVAEIKDLKKRFGTSCFRFHDDTFTIQKKRVLKFCDLLKQEKLNIRWGCDTRGELVDKELLSKMRETGCYRVNMGVESGSKKILSDVKKNISLEKIEDVFKVCKRIGIRTTAYFMAGFPGEDLYNVKETLEMMKKIKPDSPIWSVLTPFPGTEIYNYAKEHQLFSQDLDYTFYFHHNKDIRLNKKDIPDNEWDPLIDEIDREVARVKKEAMFSFIIRHPYYLLSDRWIMYYRNNPGKILGDIKKVGKAILSL